MWQSKDALMAMFASPAPSADAGKADSEPATAAGDTASEDGEVKDAVRLGENGQTVQAEPVEQSSAQQGTAQAPSTVPSSEPTTQPTDSQGSEPSTQPAGQVRSVDDNGAAQPADSTQTAQGSQPVQTEVGIPAIAQKAYLYEEGAAGAGATRDNAAMVWSLAQEPPAEGMPPEPVIKGKLDVPGRGLEMQLTMRRNVDDALPASHIIELVFTAPPDFSGGNIDNIARFVMKADEQARGEGLVAVPAKIDTGYFLIALNNLEQAAATNRKLLEESSWIDIPLGYTSGRRALVTLEKGALGDRVFRDAFADWDKR